MCHYTNFQFYCQNYAVQSKTIFNDYVAHSYNFPCGQKQKPTKKFQIAGSGGNKTSYAATLSIGGFLQLHSHENVFDHP